MTAGQGYGKTIERWILRCFPDEGVVMMNSPAPVTPWVMQPGPVGVFHASHMTRTRLRRAAVWRVASRLSGGLAVRKPDGRVSNPGTYADDEQRVAIADLLNTLNKQFHA